jgi:hypothetical protein
LRAFLRDEADYAKKMKKVVAAETDAEYLACNRSALLDIDHALRQGTYNVSLKYFEPLRRLRPLEKDEQRVIIDLPAERQIPGTSQKRSVVVNTDTNVVNVELPRVVIDGKLRRPVLHKSADQGPKQWTAMHFMDNFLGLRGTTLEDRWHRIHNDVEDAAKDSGLWLHICEFAGVYNARQAPWGGHTFHRVIKGAARAYFRTRSSKCPLFRFLYEDPLSVAIHNCAKTYLA